MKKITSPVLMLLLLAFALAVPVVAQANFDSFEFADTIESVTNPINVAVLDTSPLATVAPASALTEITDSGSVIDDSNFDFYINTSGSEVDLEAVLNLTTPISLANGSLSDMTRMADPPDSALSPQTGNLTTAASTSNAATMNDDYDYDLPSSSLTAPAAVVDKRTTVRAAPQ